VGRRRTRAANERRYKDLVVRRRRNDILAQARALINQTTRQPSSGLTVRKMILAGSSASAGVAQNYLTNAHMAQRLADMKPIYDGFMRPAPTVRFRFSMSHDPGATMRETFTGNGQRSRIMRNFAFTNLPAWRISIPASPVATTPILQISDQQYPMEAEMAIALANSSRGWTRALRLRMPTGFTLISILTTNRSSTAIKALCWRWMSLATSKAGSAPVGRCAGEELPRSERRRRAADPEPNHFIAARRVNGQDPDAQLCGLGNFETALSKDQLKKLYKNPKDYYNKVRAEIRRACEEGWALPVYREMALAEARELRSEERAQQ